MCVEEDPFKELFLGSDADIEDLLIHKYGKDKQAVYDALRDPEYDEVQKKLTALEREKAEWRNKLEWKVSWLCL